MSHAPLSAAAMLAMGLILVSCTKVDVHHIYFEGIHESDDGVWEIEWGS